MKIIKLKNGNFRLSSNWRFDAYILGEGKKYKFYDFTEQDIKETIDIVSMQNFIEINAKTLFNLIKESKLEVPNLIKEREIMLMRERIAEKKRAKR